MKLFMNFRIATTKGMFLTLPPLIFAPCIDFRNKNKDVTEPMIPLLVKLKSSLRKFYGLTEYL